MSSVVFATSARASLCRREASETTARASIRAPSAIDLRRRRGSSPSTEPLPLQRPRRDDSSSLASPAIDRRRRASSSRNRRLAASPRDDSAPSSSSSDLGATVVSFARSGFFKGPVQAVVALVVLAAVDAAYSGDWSRIGAITKEQEEALKPLVVALGLFHLLCAGVAGFYASKKGNSVPKAAAKAALVGFLAAVEAVLAEEGGQKESG